MVVSWMISGADTRAAKKPALGIYGIPRGGEGGESGGKGGDPKRGCGGASTVNTVVKGKIGSPQELHGRIIERGGEGCRGLQGRRREREKTRRLGE